jgi:hypothetical protein
MGQAYQVVALVALVLQTQLRGPLDCLQVLLAEAGAELETAAAGLVGLAVVARVDLVRLLP